MDYHEFVKNVQEEAGCDKKEQAVKAVQATLQTLGERLFGGEAEQLAAQLPHELQPYLRTAENPSKMHWDEFLQKIGSREGTDVQTAEQHAKAVISVLCRAVSQGEIEDVLAQLPQQFLKLFGRESKTVH